mmetsp:Transcript_69566/g.157278  ORF Transcript_69566/g.157278 Transcript_69566/m.157278 type:complete len:91 (-) Transcript_69566:1063-1335(-)
MFAMGFDYGGARDAFSPFERTMKIDNETVFNCGGSILENNTSAMNDWLATLAPDFSARNNGATLRQRCFIERLNIKVEHLERFGSIRTAC